MSLNSSRYQIEKQIGVGGMGKVYKAYDTKLSRNVAIKVMIDSEADAQTKERFKREIIAIGQLRHPNIIQLYDVGQEKGMPYFTMDYIEGKDLSHMIKQRKKISPKKVAEIMSKVSDALFHAHQQGIIHRDLKPSNIMINQQNNPIVMDFGLAKVDNESHELTATGTILGTISYMPPEQVDGKMKEIDERSDVYSLGAVLYEMLTGFAPFRGSMAEIITKISREFPKKPRKINTRVSKDLENICLQAMAKDKLKRYQTTRELRDDLTRYLNKKPVLAKAQSNAVLAWLQRNKIMAALHLLVLLAFIIYLCFFTANTPIKSKHLAQKKVAKTDKSIKKKPKEPVVPKIKKEPTLIIKKSKSIKYQETKLAWFECSANDILKHGLELKSRNIGFVGNKKTLLFRTILASQLYIYFHLEKKPQKVFLRVKHLASRARGKNFAPINIKLNNQYIKKDFNPGRAFSMQEYEITSEAKIGKNILLIQLGEKATSTYWLSKLYVIGKEKLQ